MARRTVRAQVDRDLRLASIQTGEAETELLNRILGQELMRILDDLAAGGVRNLPPSERESP